MKPLLNPWFPVAILACLLAGCMAGTDYRRPTLDMPAQFQTDGDPGAKDVQSQLSGGWWRLYGEPDLDRRVEQALRANLDLRLASERILEVEAALRETNASLLPQINAGANGSDARVSTTDAVAVPPGVPLVRRDYQLTASTSYELDFWGKLRRASEAARAQLLASHEARDVISLTLAAGVSQAWFLIRSLDSQIAILRQTVSTREESLSLTRGRGRGGLAGELDINQAAESLADARTQLRESERQRALAVGQLGLLTGELDLVVPAAAASLVDLALPAMPAAGLPATLLERRPDVALAEANLASANAQIGVARAAQWPTFSITGLLGGDSLSMGSVLSAPSRIWTLGGGVTLPVVDWGRFQARTEQAEARARQAAALWEKAAQTAFREVADALSNLDKSRQAEADYVDRAQRARERLRIARLRYEAGYSGFLDVLDAQRTANEAELARVRNHQMLLSYSVDFIRSLGGGWQSGPIDPAGSIAAIRR